MLDRGASARVRWSLHRYVLTGDVLVARESWVDWLRRLFGGEARATCTRHESYAVMFFVDPDDGHALAAGQATVRRALEAASPPDAWVEVRVDPAAAALGIRQWME